MSFEALLEEPGDFIAAVPAMLGIVPERSLVVVVLKNASDRKHDVHAVVRLDLPPVEQYSQLPQCILRICRRSEAVAVLAVIVDDRVSRPNADSDDLSYVDHRRMLGVLRDGLAGYGVAVAGAWGVAGIHVGAHWWNIDSPRCCGLLPDPSVSQVAVQRVVEGHVFRGTRTELAETVAVDDSLRDQVSLDLPDLVTDAQRRLVRAVAINNPDAYSRMALWRVMSVIKQVADSADVSPHTIAEVAVALRDIAVRDAMFGVAGGAHARPAERLWGVLTRALPDPDRAEAATLLAFSAYLRGEGVLAAIALEQALVSDPMHRMALLLDAALQAAMPPDRLNQLVRCGVETAAELRIDIGAAATDSGMGVVR
ncbi:DUF4192 domain-containing protein [Nocardia uniformis]|nr:DUF4192 domain-containing protein [Nocardia uniformis]